MARPDVRFEFDPSSPLETCLRFMKPNLSLLFGESFESVQDLNRFRKALAPA